MIIYIYLNLLKWRLLTKSMVDILYEAKTKEEFANLEKWSNKFFESYNLKVNMSNIFVSAAVNKGVNITPKGGKIEEVVTASEPAVGRFFKCTEEYAILDIGDLRYMIRYNPLK